jgi:hypothetical protein
MNFIIGLPKYKGKSAIMMIVDRLTKYTQFCALNVNLCIYITYLSVHVLYINLPQELCTWICFNHMQIENCMWNNSVWMLSMLQYVLHRERMCSLA